VQSSDRESLLALQQQIHESIERVRRAIDEAKDLLRNCDTNLDALSLELVDAATREEYVA